MDAHKITHYPDPYEAFGIAQGYRYGNLIVLSGQIAMTPEGEIVGKGDIAAQAEQAFANIEAILNEAGSNLRSIIKMTTYVTDMSKVGELTDLRAKLFGKPPPAETLVEVSALALPDLMIEIDAMAITGGIPRPSLPPY
ncbi:MAG: RidA family protein [Alphaproteobacteria bacterium]